MQYLNFIIFLFLYSCSSQVEKEQNMNLNKDIKKLKSNSEFFTFLRTKKSKEEIDQDNYIHDKVINIDTNFISFSDRILSYLDNTLTVSNNQLKITKGQKIIYTEFIDSLHHFDFISHSKINGDNYDDISVTFLTHINKQEIEVDYWFVFDSIKKNFTKIKSPFFLHEVRNIKINNEKYYYTTNLKSNLIESHLFQVQKDSIILNKKLLINNNLFNKPEIIKYRNNKIESTFITDTILINYIIETKGKEIEYYWKLIKN